MRGVHSAVDDIRRNVFKEVARLGYEGGVSVEAPVTSPEAWRGMAETNLRLLRAAFGDEITEEPAQMR